MSEQPAVSRGVIHDLGYRGYAGAREGTGAIARTLFLTGLRHCFGLGRSGRSKVLPFLRKRRLRPVGPAAEGGLA